MPENIDMFQQESIAWRLAFPIYAKPYT